MDGYGFLVVDQKAKVTMPVKVLEKLTKIPVSIGFKQWNKSWENVFMDIVVFPSDAEAAATAQTLQKGDRIKVSGKFNISRYKDKEQYSIIANKLEVESTGPRDDTDAPF